MVDSFRKLAPVPLLAIALATGAILFVSEAVAERLGVLEFRVAYRGYIGTAFLIAWAYLLAHLIWWSRARILESMASRRARRVRRKYLHDLSPQERGYLLPYVEDKINTQNFAIEDGVIGGLARKGIVYRGSNVFHVLEGAPWNIQPWALEYLRRHPELLEGAAGPSQPARDDRW